VLGVNRGGRLEKVRKTPVPIVTRKKSPPPVGVGFRYWRGRGLEGKTWGQGLLVEKT